MAGTSDTIGANWRLSVTLSGHSMDVRAVAATPDGCILSASRDTTAKLWHPTGIRDFTNEVTYKGHSNFVSCICYLPPCESFPGGLVMTGGNDKTIFGYNIADPSPTLVLKGHENAVCYLSTSRIPGILYSASWDGTACVWSVNEPGKPLKVLKGHQAVVWSVIELGDGNIATASADKTIFLWNPEGEKLKSLTGHTDCIRGLTVASPETFLSCANDASIRLWTNQGKCLNTFFGHTNYIYSICSNPYVDNHCFITSGEDSTIRVWSGGDNICTITIPAQSIWSVSCLSNGDIVAGSSDGLVRVFTKDPTRQADDLSLKQFEEEVMKLQEASSQEIGGVKVTDLPGPEVLYEPGKTDGQTKLVRTGAKVKCYSWSAQSQTWNEVGDVMGSAGPAEGKQIFQGKEYDFVFSVDIEDGKPPLKLPYNIGEDPWIVAQNFIHKNQLPQVYLERVANFIIENSNQGSNNVPKDSNFMDPFTGESRYIPSDNNSTKSSSQNSVTNSTSSSQKSTKNYFPQKTYLRFDKADISVIFGKLQEFNEKANPNEKMSSEDLEEIIKLAEKKLPYNAIIINKLKQMLNWPQDLLFPVLDVTRLLLRDKNVNADLFDNSFGMIFFKILLKNLDPDYPVANQLLSLRTLVNAFSHKTGENIIIKEQEDVLNALICLQNCNKNTQVAIATLLLNLCIGINKESNTMYLCQCLLEISTRFVDNEAQFRLLAALGTLILLAPNRTDITSIIKTHSEFLKGLKNNITASDADPMKQKLSLYSKEILQLI